MGRLAIKLAAILDGFDVDKPDEFVGRSTAMTTTLASASYGTEMLRIIGFVYEKQANEFVNDPVGGLGTWADLGLRSTYARFEQARGRVNSQVNAAQAGWKAYSVYRAGEAEALKAGADADKSDRAKQSEGESQGEPSSKESPSDAKSASADAARAKYTQNAMPHVLEALWNASALDIEHTIRNVCFKVRGFPVSHAPPSGLRILVLRREHYEPEGTVIPIPHTMEYSIPFPIPHTNPSYTWSDRLTLTSLPYQGASRLFGGQKEASDASRRADAIGAHLSKRQVSGWRETGRDGEPGEGDAQGVY